MSNYLLFFADLLFKLNADLIQNATNTQEFLFFKCSRSVPVLPFMLYLHYSNLVSYSANFSFKSVVYIFVFKHC